MRLLLTVASALCAMPLPAHHSTLGVFDRNNIIEISGVVTGKLWRNPHPTFTVAVTGEDGEMVEWDVETGAVSTLRLRGLQENFIQVGDNVRMAGEASARGLPELYARNMLLADGREVLISATSVPRWTGGDPTRLYQGEFDEAVAQRSRATADGIYRTWTSILGDADSFPMYTSSNDWPLTSRGIELKEAFVPRESPYIRCGRKGMTYVMQTPYPIAFERRGEDIAIRFEEMNATRMIHMNESEVPDDAEYSIMGYSVGHWEDDTLVVRTEKIDFPHFYGDGTPLSDSLWTLERFTMSADESRLDYELYFEDAEMFTQPMRFNKYWAWKPEIDLRPYDCEY